MESTAAVTSTAQNSTATQGNGTTTIQNGDTSEKASMTANSVSSLGQGYDSIRSSGRSTIVAGASSSPGVTTQSYYRVCTSVESLNQALQMSGSVTANFGFGSADAKASFAESLKVTTTSLSIVVYTSVMTYHQVLTDWHLTGAAPSDANAFFQAYGDSFVSEIAKGSEYMAVCVFYCQSVDEQEQVKTQLSAQGITDGGSLSGDFQSSFNQAMSSVTTEETVQQLITGFTQPPPLPSTQGIVDFALDFPSKAPDSPATLFWATTSYSHVPGVPDFTAIDKTVDLFEGSSTAPGLADDYATLAGVQNQIAWINAVYQGYGGFSDPSLSSSPGSKAAMVDADLATLTSLFNQMEANPSAAYTAPQLPSLALGTPALTYTASAVPAEVWGGSGGNPWQDVTSSSVQEQVLLTAITIDGGSYVDALKCSYRAKSSSQSTSHGGSGGNASNPLDLGPGERIVSIGVTWGSYVNSLVFQTNFGNKLAWPTKPQSCPHSTTWQVPSGSYLLGFQGRAGKYLDQLQPVIVTFSPAVWSTT